MPGSMSPAGVLLMEDTLNRMIYKDGSRSLQRQKAKGLLPRGSHSCFGDFPPDLMPERLRSLARSQSDSRAGELVQCDPTLLEPPLRPESSGTWTRTRTLDK
ncbi:unnamed protein product [Effrenium voratum]|nr:unnamed protein product [Effrenium voratum]